MTFPLETLPLGDPIGGVVYLRIVLSPEETSRIYGISVFGKKLHYTINKIIQLCSTYLLLTSVQHVDSTFLVPTNHRFWAFFNITGNCIVIAHT
jgi:hypothetical protein